MPPNDSSAEEERLLAAYAVAALSADALGRAALIEADADAVVALVGLLRLQRAASRWPARSATS